MRTFLGAVAVVVLVVGIFFFVLSRLVGPSSAHGASGAYTKSTTCARNDPALSIDRKDAARFATSEERALGLAWHGFRAVALFAASSRIARTKETSLASGLSRQGVPSAEVSRRVLREGYVVMLYVSGSPTRAAEAALGRCVYLIRSNRIASFFGLDFPHTERPFVPGGEQGR